MKGWRVIVLSVLGGLLMAGLAVSSAAAVSRNLATGAAVESSSGAPAPVSAPFVSTTVITPALCRLGVGGAQRPLTDYPTDTLASLRTEWFIDWSVRTDRLQSLPNAMQYAPSIFIKQWKWENAVPKLVDWDAPYADPPTYTINPPLQTLAQLAVQYPGQLWLAGNEIERRDWQTDSGGSMGQQEILPELYAQAYHAIYTTIKTADPTARIANGSIILPSPLRLEYLSKVWDAYYDLYDAPMPVDVWQIHLYLLQEKRYEWGADIPAGSSATTGLYAYPTYEEVVRVNKDFSKVPGLVRDMRSWMKAHGQQDKPLIISEYGINMPDWILPGEFDPDDIYTEYLEPSLDYLMHESDTALGYPADDYRLVQSVWWWSLDADNGDYEGATFYQAYNGNLLYSGIMSPTHSPNPMGISALGSYWVDYVSAVTETVNLKPLSLEPRTPVYSTAGQPVTVSLELLVSNGGNVAVTQPFSVTLTDQEVSQQIGALTVTAPVEGCGGVVEVTGVLWLDLDPGPHTVQVTVDGSGLITETNETDNIAQFTVVVATHQIRLPVVLRRAP
ncbi:MAG: hypothetical protein P1S60_05765 [Anaerolineae bacterium]|nr:hypothetical protein [Anaerolineae bacterium]